ncbi:SH3 domain-binding protein 5 homolog [Anneissia japonica]|uniref:SH3 domain-binding protein 5 homolog n=1 Tax=Anneissia japonica TaxID=1529436 RepID=UPI0014256D3C|nr:SH3 domain-binding protein 5 homolog [Anneissia japonica]
MATPDEGDKLDPRVKVELERLNSATHEINTLEFQLDEARSSFRHALTESTQSLNATAKRLGACIEKARPFYDARQRAKELHQSTQQAAVSFERANSMLAAAKEMVDLAEMGLLDEGREFDANWQEMLNHATMKVGEAELEKNISERQHERTAAEFDQEELVVKRLQKSLKSVINKSRPYFEAKSNFNQQMEEKKQKVRTLEIKVARSKEIYSQALHNLEEISSEIHEKRKTQSVKLGKRVAGVGAEAVPEVHIEKCRTPPSHLKFGTQTTPSKRLASPRDEMVTRDDMFLGIPNKTQTPKRPLSLQEAILPPDPHNILGERGSLENLDNISDNDSVCSDQSQEHDTAPVTNDVQTKSTISYRTHRRVSSEASNVMFGLSSSSTRLRIANSSSSSEPLQIVQEISSLNISSENAFSEDDAEKLSSICEIKSIKQLPNSQLTEVISDVCVSDNSESQSTINGEHLDSPSSDSSRVPKGSTCIGGEDDKESSTGALQDGAFNCSTETTIF